MDPLASKYPGWSPYNYVLGNPLRLIDPNGMESAEVKEERERKQKEEDEKKKRLEEVEAKRRTSGTALDYYDILSGFNTVMINALEVGSLNALDNTAQAVSDNSSVAAVALFLGGFVTEGATWTMLPATLGVGNTADWVSAGAKTGKAMMGSGTWEDATKQSGVALLNTVAGYALNKLSEQVVVRTGLSNTLFRNALNGRFVSNRFGKTVEAVRDAVSVPIGYGIQKLIR